MTAFAAESKPVKEPFKNREHAIERDYHTANVMKLQHNKEKKNVTKSYRSVDFVSDSIRIG